MKNKKVSVIVAIYNVEKFLNKCIDSIINQDYENLEIILVDDCSFDNSGIICDEYAKLDNRVKVIHHKENKRQSQVRNTGLDSATGEYIVFVDGDDWLATDFISYMLHVIESTSTEIAINMYNFTSRDMEQINQIENISVELSEDILEIILYPKISVGVWNKIYKRDFIEKYKLRFDTNLFTAEGFRFVTTAVQKTEKIGVGKKKVYYYRLNNSESAVTKYDIRQSLGAINACNDIERDLTIRTPKIINAYNHQLWWNHFWNIRQIIALKLIKTNKNELKNSVRFVKYNAKKAIIDEKNIKRKLKYYVAGIFPIMTAYCTNKMIDYKLKKDLKSMIEEENERINNEI